MRRLLALALVLAAAPSSAAWRVPGAAPVQASTGRITAVAEPTTTMSCAGTGSVGVQVRWTSNASRLTGHEVWRVRDGVTTLITTVGPTTTSAQDVQSYGAVTLQYYVVSRNGSWRAQSPVHTAAALPLCA